MTVPSPRAAPPDEAELVSRIREGDHEALSSAYYQHAATLLTLDARFLAHHADTLNIWQPVPSSILAVLQGALLSSDWKSSVPLLASSEEGVVVRNWFNLRVYGEEEIEVFTVPHPPAPTPAELERGSARFGTGTRNSGY